MQRLLRKLHAGHYSTRWIRRFSHSTKELLETEISRRQVAPIIPHLLLSPHSPPPIAKPEQTANFFIASADSFVFSYAMFDIALVLHKARLLGTADLLDSPHSLFVPPRSLVRNPSSKNRFGPARLTLLATVLDSLLQEHEASPRSLSHAAAALSVTCPQVVPLLRGLCLCAEVHHPFTPQVAYVLEELRTHGFVTPHLFIEGEHAQREGVLAELLLYSAMEFGSASVLYTGLQLNSQLNAPLTPYDLSRRVCRAVTAEDRRKLDWALKARGAPRHRFSAQQGWTHHLH